MNNLNEQNGQGLPPEIAQLAAAEQERKNREGEEAHQMIVESAKETAEKLRPWADVLRKITNLGVETSEGRRYISSGIAEMAGKKIETAHNSVPLFRFKDAVGHEILYTLEWRQLGPSAVIQDHHKPLGKAPSHAVSIVGDLLYQNDDGKIVRPNQGGHEVWWSPDDSRPVVVKKVRLTPEYVDGGYEKIQRMASSPFTGLWPEEKDAWAVDPGFMEQCYGKKTLVDFEPDRMKRSDIKDKNLGAFGWITGGARGLADEDVKVVQPKDYEVERAIFSAAWEAEKAGVKPEEITTNAEAKIEELKRKVLSGAGAK